MRQEQSVLNSEGKESEMCTVELIKRVAMVFVIGALLLAPAGAAKANLILDPTMSTNPIDENSTPWYKVAGTDVIWYDGIPDHTGDGSGMAQIFHKSAPSARIRQDNIAVPPNTDLTLSYWAVTHNFLQEGPGIVPTWRTVRSTLDDTVLLEDSTDVTYAAEYPAPWAFVSTTFNTGVYDNIYLDFWQFNRWEAAWIDDVRLVPEPATVGFLAIGGVLPLLARKRRR